MFDLWSHFTVHAATIDNPLGVSTIGELATKILQPVVPIAGIIFVGLVIYGGFNYMVSTGDPQKVKQAQGILTTGVIGLVIVLAAFFITNWIGNILGVDL